MWIAHDEADSQNNIPYVCGAILFSLWRSLLMAKHVHYGLVSSTHSRKIICPSLSKYGTSISMINFAYKTKFAQYKQELRKL
jgi:hypothetical protein